MIESSINKNGENICKNFFSHNMEKIAIVDSNGEILTYFELLCSAIDVALELEKRKCAKRILLYGGNTIEFVIGLCAIWMSGRTAVLVDINRRKIDIENIYKDCESDTIIYSSLAKINCLIAKNNILPIKKSIRYQYEFCLNSEIAVLFPTSGTTDDAKYVMLEMEGIFEECEGINEAHGYNRETKEIIIVPVTSSCGCLGQLVPILYAGGTLILYKGEFNVFSLRSALREFRPNVVVCTSSILALLLKERQTTYEDFSSVNAVICAGEPTDINLFSTLKKKFGIQSVTQAYGLTETSSQVSGSALDFEAPFDSVGKITKNFEVRIKDGDIVKGKNELGEIQVKGKATMRGYFKNEELTQKSYEGEWLKTGDIGYLDEKGYLYIKGRTKNVIIVSGKNIYPEEIEKVLLKIPSINSVRVYSKKSNITGEKIVADVVINNGMQESRENIEEFCRNNLMQYMRPREIRIISEQGINTSGKMSRKPSGQ